MVYSPQELPPQTMLKRVKAAPDEKIYATDVNKNGAKVFYAKSMLAMWRHMQKMPRYHSEVIKDAPCHLFWDFDEGDVRAEWRKLKVLLDKLFSSLGIQVEHLLLDASKGTKKSLHVITKSDKYLLESPVQGRTLIGRMRTLFGDDMPNIDETIYTRNRCFRMLGSSKYGQNRPFKGKWSMEGWVQTLVQPGTLDVHNLGLGAVVPAPMRYGESLDTPDCITDVLDWAGASDYRWKVDLQWVWKGHLTKGVCRFAKRVHRRNNRYFTFTPPNNIYVGCHHCRKGYRIEVPDELAQPVQKFLNRKIKL
jgi:hypothetical protein